MTVDIFENFYLQACPECEAPFHTKQAIREHVCPRFRCDHDSVWHWVDKHGWVLHDRGRKGCYCQPPARKIST